MDTEDVRPFAQGLSEGELQRLVEAIKRDRDKAVAAEREACAALVDGEHDAASPATAICPSIGVKIRARSSGTTSQSGKPTDVDLNPTELMPHTSAMEDAATAAEIKGE